MEFYTSPIARGHGQMRIRTESSFLEPRFASIYAYGCRSLVSPMPMSHYDRLDTEPRKRELNSVPGSTASRDSDDDFEEENETMKSPIDNDKEEDHPELVVAASSSAAAMLDSLWRSRNDIAREMEDIFLRSASQAITHYIEKQLHPAIKETLMLSMGYTISYG